MACNMGLEDCFVGPISGLCAGEAHISVVVNFYRSARQHQHFGATCLANGA